MNDPKNENPVPDSAPGAVTRREALKMGAGAAMGAASVLAAGEFARLAAQEVVNPTPIPATDPRYPMPPLWPQELKQLAPNIYAFTQAGGPGRPSAGVSNMGLIAGSDYLWAIDGSQGPLPARAFIAASKAATGKEIARLLLTHHHRDHIDGLQFFEHAEVWSHPYCRAEVVKTIPHAPKTWTPTPGVADVAEPRRVVVPMLTVPDNMTIYVGDTEVRFLWAGTCHTWGDMMAYLPKQKILFAGDIGFFYVAPYANNSYISKWLDTCDRIVSSWDVDVIVPGHGPIGGKKELAEMADYFRVLGVEARKRYDKKMSPGAAAAEIRLGKFDNWRGPERIIMDTVRWYEEWDGTLTPDYNAAAVRGATIEYNEVKAAQSKLAEMIPIERMEAFAAHAC